MKEAKLSDEQVKKMASAIVAKITESKADGTYDDAETQATLKRLAEAQVVAAHAAQMIKRKGEFEEAEVVAEKDVEKALLAEFKDVDELNNSDRMNLRYVKMNTPVKRLKLREGDSLGEQIEEFKELNDDAYLVATMLRGAAIKSDAQDQNFMNIYRKTDIYKEIHGHLERNKELRKALAVATAASGAEWIPTGFSSQVLLSIELATVVPALFNTIAMPTSPYTLPVQTSNAEASLVSENTADEGVKAPASTPGTGNSSFTARKLMTRTLFSEEINEDSIVAIRNFTINEISKSLARGHETAVVNGDRTTAAGVATAHQDNAGTALFSSNQDARLAFDGLRYFALNQADTSTKDFSNAVPSDALMNAIRLLMGKHAVKPSDFCWLVSVNGYLQMIGNLTNTTTLEKYGPQATVLTGELMRYQNAPVIVSEYMFSNLNASGVYDGSTTSRSNILAVYRPGFLNGTRGGVTLATANDIETDQVILVGKRRVDFIDPYGATTTGNVQAAMGISVKTT